MRNLNVISMRQRLYKQYFMENRIAEILWHGYTESRICGRIRPASLALLVLKGEISMSEKDEIIAIVSYVKVNISGQMGGTDSAILMRMGKRKRI